MGDWILPAKYCSSLTPWGTSKANGIEPIRLTVSSMSCDLSMVIAYYDDKWTHLSNWSLSTQFSSFLETWGHYLSTSDRQERQQWEQIACMNRHRWLFYPNEYIYSYFWWNCFFFNMDLSEHSLFSLEIYIAFLTTYEEHHSPSPETAGWISDWYLHAFSISRVSEALLYGRISFLTEKFALFV